MIRVIMIFMKDYIIRQLSNQFINHKENIIIYITNLSMDYQI